MAAQKIVNKRQQICEKNFFTWYKGKYVGMCQGLETVCWESLFEAIAALECYVYFMVIYIDLIDRYVQQRHRPIRYNRLPKALLRQRSKAD